MKPLEVSNIRQGEEEGIFLVDIAKFNASLAIKLPDDDPMRHLLPLLIEIKENPEGVMSALRIYVSTNDTLPEELKSAVAKL